MKIKIKKEKQSISINRDLVKKKKLSFVQYNESKWETKYAKWIKMIAQCFSQMWRWLHCPKSLNKILWREGELPEIMFFLREKALCFTRRQTWIFLFSEKKITRDEKRTNFYLSTRFLNLSSFIYALFWVSMIIKLHYFILMSLRFRDYKNGN